MFHGNTICTHSHLKIYREPDRQTYVAPMRLSQHMGEAHQGHVGVDTNKLFGVFLSFAFQVFNFYRLIQLQLG